MDIIDGLKTGVLDPENFIGVFLSARPAELAPFVKMIAGAGASALVKDPRHTDAPDAPCRYPDLLAAGVVELLSRTTPRPSALTPLGAARWLLRRLGDVSADPGTLIGLDLLIIENLATRAKLGRIRDADFTTLEAGLPPASPENLVAMRLVLALSCLRRDKMMALRRTRRALWLPGPVPVVEPPARTVAEKPAEAEPPPEADRKLANTSWQKLLGAAADLPLDVWEEKLKEARAELGRFNIIVAGRTGVGKTTLIGAVFGKEVGDTLAGRPRTRGRIWYPEKPGDDDILRLCDTEGLEMERFDETLEGLRSELARRNASSDPLEHVHVAWLCIDEPSLTIQPGEEKAADLFAEFEVPVICVLTKAGMAPDFQRTVGALLPQCRAVVRVRAAPIEIEGQSFPPMGLDRLIAETQRAIPLVSERAWLVASRNLDGMTARAMRMVQGAAAAAGATGATPLPMADAAGVFGIQASMIIGVSLQMGVKLQRRDLRAMAITMLGALGVTAGGRYLVGRALKFIPGVGSVVGAALTGGTAAALTYGLGRAYVQYLRRFHQDHGRMPDAGEIVSGFETFWRDWRDKKETPPAPDATSDKDGPSDGAGR